MVDIKKAIKNIFILFGALFVLILLVVAVMPPAEQPIAPPTSAQVDHTVLAPTPTAPAQRERVEVLNQTGFGKKVVGPLQLQDGLALVSMAHAGGKSNFIVWLLDGDGKQKDLMANEVGDWSGTKALNIGKTGTYLIDVTADGRWAISIIN